MPLLPHQTPLLGRSETVEDLQAQTEAQCRTEDRHGHPQIRCCPEGEAQAETWSAVRHRVRGRSRQLAAIWDHGQAPSRGDHPLPRCRSSICHRFCGTPQLRNVPVIASAIRTIGIPFAEMNPMNYIEWGIGLLGHIVIVAITALIGRDHHEAAKDHETDGWSMV